MLRLTLCDPLNYTTPGRTVLRNLREFAQIHVRQVAGAIQPYYPLLPPSPFALNLSQHQSFLISQLFASRGPSIIASTSAIVLPMNMQC